MQGRVGVSEERNTRMAFVCTFGVALILTIGIGCGPFESESNDCDPEPCGEPPDCSEHSCPVCEPGETNFCACPGGGIGTQLCVEDGHGWDHCQCDGVSEDVGPEPEPDMGLDTGDDGDADLDAAGDVDDGRDHPIDHFDDSAIYPPDEIMTSTWSGTVYITGDKLVVGGETLLIEAGTSVVFAEIDQDVDGVGDYELVVEGRLIVQGTLDNPVVFTTLSSGSDADASSWNTVRLTSLSLGNIIDHARFEFADVGLEVMGEATISNTDFESCRVGLHVRDTGYLVSLAVVNAHHNTEDGIIISNADVFSSDLVSELNGGRGVLITEGSTTEIRGCSFAENGSHGAEIADSSAIIAHCQLTDNGKTGVFYRGQATGQLTYSQIEENAHEGVRALGGRRGDPSVAIEFNNIFGNADSGRMEFVSAGVTAQSIGSSTGDYPSTLLSTPSGQPILAVEISYAEYSTSSLLNGRIITGDGTLVETIPLPTSGWFNIAEAGADSIRALVDDGSSSSYAILTIGRIAFVEPSTSRELTAVLDNEDLPAQHNYFGVWPEVLDAVAATGNAVVDVQGFVGEAFDDSWNIGVYHGAETIDTDETWTENVFITGDVEIAASGSLTIEPGVNVMFVPIDQDLDEVGDYEIARRDGDLTVDAPPDNQVIVTVLGTAPAGGGYQQIRSSGSGSTDLSGVRISGGRHGLWSQSGRDTISNVEITNTADDGVRIDGTASLVGDGFAVTSSAANGIHVTTSGWVSLENFDVISAEGWGIVFDGANNSANAISSCTIRENADGGIRFRHAVADVNHCDIDQNTGYGMRLEGSGSGLISMNDIADNHREGILAVLEGRAHPAWTVNHNNIASNADADTYPDALISILHHEGVTALSIGPSIGVYPSNTYDTAGPELIAVWAEYSEYSSSSLLTGYAETDDGTMLATLATDSSVWIGTGWANATAIRGVVEDRSSSNYAILTLSDFLYADTPTSAPYSQMTAVFNETTIDATKNYWGGADVENRVFEVTVGSVDYSSFLLTPVGGAGRQ